MKLEKRAFFAFILSMVLFLVYDYVYLSPKMKAQQARRKALQAAQDSVQANSLTTMARPADDLETSLSPQEPAGDYQSEQPVGISLPVVRADSAGSIVVTTPLFRMNISKAGGEIRTVELLQFDTGGLPVQLLLQDLLEPGLGGIDLVGERQELSLSSHRFEAYLSGVGSPLPDNHEVRVDDTESEKEIVFRLELPDGRTVSRYFRFFGDSYQVITGVRFDAQAFPFTRQIRWGFGSGIRSTELNQQDDYQNFKAFARLGEEIHDRKPANFENNKVEKYSGMVTWASLQTKYFTTVLIPAKPAGGAVEMTGDKHTHHLTTKVMLPAVEKRGRIEQEVAFYLGPLDYGILKDTGLGLEKNISMGYKLFRPVSWVILWSLVWMYKFIPNYGIVILIISVFTKILFYRLTHKSFKSMRDMQALQPKLQALKEKYKEDKQKLSAETMRIYKEHGVNPLGGCLPLLLQMPVFIALFSVLKYTIVVRQAHFFGWITDLSQQDVLTTLPFSLPLIGAEVSVLPLLMGAAMVLQTKIGGSMTPGSVSNQPKFFNYMLPIVFTFIFYKMPSGLVLYWFVNNILTIAQQYYINKNVDDDNDKGSGAKGDGPAPAANGSKTK
jgi:YidC/Oxa1 family membrane protein insertase